MGDMTKDQTETKYDKCVYCNEPFSDKNVMTLDGWRETQISGTCEKCFDDICDERNFE